MHLLQILQPVQDDFDISEENEATLDIKDRPEVQVREGLQGGCSPQAHRGSQGRLAAVPCKCATPTPICQPWPPWGATLCTPAGEAGPPHPQRGGQDPEPASAGQEVLGAGH